MRVFLTGGTGFIGGHIAERLLADGHELTILTRHPRGSSTEVEYVVGDLSEPGSYAGLLDGHDVLVHNALVWDEELTELEFKDPRLSLALFRAAGEAGIGRVAYTSSVAVHRPFSASMNEDTPLRPAEYYGMSKASSELCLFAAASEFGFKANVLRPGPTVGAPATNGGHASDRRIQEYVRAALAGEPIDVTDAGGRQFTPARGFAEVLAQLLVSEFDRQAFVCVDQATTSWLSIAQLAVAITGSSSNVSCSGDPEPGSWFDTSKVDSAFGVSLSSAEALQEHVRYLAGSGGK
ncbi:MAG: NAD(P)-dependent oxidoreductase [Armatimonadetes bacterium]|nr:NAD(P)-dependent oxidoreductase [Armatimonadota bacterium]